jgi:hypothetical protein
MTVQSIRSCGHLSGPPEAEHRTANVERSTSKYSWFDVRRWKFDVGRLAGFLVLLVCAIGLRFSSAKADSPSKAGPAAAPTDLKPPDSKSSPADKPPPADPTGRPGTTLLFQEVLIARRPSFNVAGISISQDLQYRVLSKLHVGSRAADGIIDVKQVVYETKLIKSDGLSRAAFDASLRDMRGQEFRYSLDKDNQVVKFAGPKDTRKIIKADGLTGDGFLLSSVMDDDAWKELAQVSFFLPPSPLKRGVRFERKLTHDWGPLGSWYGKTVYNPLGERSGEQRIDYAHYMHWKPPEKGKPMLLEISSATFKIERASGTIYYDPKTARVRGATERFLVRGTVNTMVLGQAVETQVEESQDFAVRVMDKLPSGGEQP